MAQCPFCEYTGSTSSVEAHVSGSTNGEHRGKLGKHFRKIIEGSIDESDVVDVPEMGEVSEPTSDEVSSPTPDPTPGGANQGGEPLGLPLWGVAGVALLLLVLVALTWDSGPAPETAPAQEDPKEQPVLQGV